VPERPSIAFIADETDETDLQAVVAQLSRLGAVGARIHPAEVSFDCRDGRVEAFQRGAPLSSALVVGWLFEDWLAPGIALLDMLRLAGLRVINTGDVLFRGQNKALMSAHLQAAGVPHEAVWFSWDEKSIRQWAGTAQLPVVVKPGLVVAGGRTVCTSGGGVVRADEPDGIEAIAGVLANFRQPLYAQRYVPKPGGRDIRIWLFGYRPVAACYKVPPAGEWITHASTGAKLVECPMVPALIDIGERAARAIGSPIAGIDVAETPDGSYTVLEVNTCPTFHPANVLFEDTIPKALAGFLAEEASVHTAVRHGFS
jgi:RimK family alpha-L-glutamate ligase